MGGSRGQWVVVEGVWVRVRVRVEGGTHALVELHYMCLFPWVVVEDEGEGGWMCGYVGGTHALVEGGWYSCSG